MLKVNISKTWNTSVLVITIALLLSLSGYVLFDPIKSANILANLYASVAKKFELSFLYIGFLILIFLITLALSPFGKFKIVLPNKSVYSFISWSSMLFATGMGAALLYWATIEWIYYYNDPLDNLNSYNKLLLARSYPLFHWTFTGWAIYCLPAVAFGLALYLRPNAPLTFSGILISKNSSILSRALSRALDVFFIGAILSGAGVGLGLSFPLISSVFANIFNVEKSFTLDLIALFVCLIIFGTSVFLGLDNGIKRLSNFNVFLLLIFLILIFLLGPTQYIINNTIDSVVYLSQNYLSWSLNSGTKYSLDWTVFYWAWYLALAPAIGTFIINISNNKTIRQIILGTILIGSLGCFLNITIMTNLSTYLYESNLLNSPEILKEGLMKPEILIIESIVLLPYGEYFLMLFGVILIIFLCTTYDSASYILASASMNKSKYEPSRFLRVIFAITLVVQPGLIMFMGGTESFKWILVIFSIPLLIVNLFLILSIFKNAYSIRKT